jgi:release factor glutamine methyltransferase
MAETVSALLSDRDAREIVAALLDVPRSWPALNPDAPLTPALRARVDEAARLRRAGAPLAYAVGRAAFRHLTLDVDARVLIPRPETEVLVDLVLQECATGIVVDVGTGSGAVALSLATEGAFDQVIGTDISTGALAVAAANGRAVGATVEWRAGSFLAPVRDIRMAAVVSNPPYISFDEAWALPASVRDWEPPVALLSGDDGMAAIRAIVREAAGVLRAGGLLAFEADARRIDRAAAIVGADGRYEDVRVRPDLTGRDRFVLARRIHNGTSDYA